MNSAPKKSNLGNALTPPSVVFSNRSLQDSIWATPEKRSTVSDKTPTQKDYGQREAKGARTRYEHISMEDALCSNQAERAGREKLRVFERKDMGLAGTFLTFPVSEKRISTSPWLDGTLQASKNGHAFHLRRRRSYPRLRHSVLAWWAGVEQEQTTGGVLPTEPEAPPEFEEHRFDFGILN